MQFNNYLLKGVYSSPIRYEKVGYLQYPVMKFVVYYLGNPIYTTNETISVDAHREAMNFIESATGIAVTGALESFAQL